MLMCLVKVLKQKTIQGKVYVNQRCSKNKFYKESTLWACFFNTINNCIRYLIALAYKEYQDFSGKTDVVFSQVKD